MKKYTLFFVAVSLLSVSVMTSAIANNSLKNEEIYPIQGCKKTAQKPLKDSERDHLMFTNFIGIIINFVKLFLNPHNIPEAKQNATNILNGVYNLANVITRSPLSEEMKCRLVQFIINYCQEQQAMMINKEELCEAA